MGNWRTVRIIGTCGAADVPALRKAVNAYADTKHRSVREWDVDAFHCLSNTQGVFGLNDWTGETIDALGNLAERDYSVEDVAECLAMLVALSPSLRVKVHCGGDYEEPICVATITCADGAVAVGPPEVKTVGDLANDDLEGRLFSAIQNARRL